MPIVICCVYVHIVELILRRNGKNTHHGKLKLEDKKIDVIDKNENKNENLKYGIEMVNVYKYCFTALVSKIKR